MGTAPGPPIMSAPPTVGAGDQPIAALGYVGISSARLAEWEAFATSRLGLQLADATRRQKTLRMDDRRQRVLVLDDAQHGFFGWEVSSQADMDRLNSSLHEARVPAEPMRPGQCRERFVAGGLTFTDPCGNQLEAVIDPEIDSTKFVPGREHSGFRTGPLGLGHAVLTTPHFEPMVSFYRDILGFRLSDYTRAPFRASFFHLNSRHHSLAIIEAPQVGMHHLMIEMNNLDDVGQAYDLALAEPDTIGVTLGRHSNDHMFSFYSRTPSNFMIETGWGGRSIDPATWEPCELIEGPSLWGHERFWLSADQRDEAFRMRVDAARNGFRAPVHVRPGNYDVAEDVAHPVVSTRAITQ